MTKDVQNVALKLKFEKNKEKSGKVLVDERGVTHYFVGGEGTDKTLYKGSGPAQNAASNPYATALDTPLARVSPTHFEMSGVLSLPTADFLKKANSWKRLSRASRSWQAPGGQVLTWTAHDDSYFTLHDEAKSKSDVLAHYGASSSGFGSKRLTIGAEVMPILDLVIATLLVVDMLSKEEDDVALEVLSSVLGA